MFEYPEYPNDIDYTDYPYSPQPPEEAAALDALPNDFLVVRYEGQVDVMGGAELAVISAEQVPPVERLSQDVDAFVAQFTTATETLPITEEAVADFLETADIGGAVAACAATADIEGIQQVLEAVDRFEIAAGSSHFLRRVDLDAPDVAAALEIVYAQRSPALTSILERATDTGTVTHDLEAHARILQRIVGCHEGGPSEWRQDGVPNPSAPEFLRRMAASPDFPQVCLAAEADYIAEEAARGNLSFPLFGAASERLLRNVSGLNGPMVNDIILGMHVRNLWKVETTRLTRNDGDGGRYSVWEQVDLEPWRQAVGRIMHHTQTLGAQTMQDIFDMSRIVCADRYSDAQMGRMARLVQGDPDVDLESADMTLVMTDVGGDEDNNLTEQIAEYENHAENVFFGEFSRPIDLYRVPVALARRCGFVASTSVVILHSNANILSVGNPLGDGVDIGIGGHSEFFYDIRKTQVKRLLHAYMRPHSVSGERTVVISGCDAATTSRDGPSTAESLISLTDPKDNVAVSGARGDIAVQRVNLADPDDQAFLGRYIDVTQLPQGEIVVFWDVIGNTPIPAEVFRQPSDPSRRVWQLQWPIPGVR